MTIIIERDKTILQQHSNGRVLKTLKEKNDHTALGPEWFDHYKSLQVENEHLVKVFEMVDDFNIIMEQLDILCPLNDIFKDKQYNYLITRTFFCDIFEIVNLSWIQALKYSNSLPDEKTIFVHNDFSLHNIVLTRDLDIKIIDPDSYRMIIRLEYADDYFITQMRLMNFFQCYLIGGYDEC